MKYFLFVLRLLLGVFFILSALAKLNPIEPFEYNFVDQGIVGWNLAPYFARFVIAFEVFIGLMLMLGYRTRKLTYPLTFGMLVFFTGYLLVQLYQQGNSGDCGCFGTYFQMTPLESIAKNLLLMSITSWLYFKESSFYFWPKPWIGAVAGLISISAVFILNMPDAYFEDSYSPQYKTGEMDYNLLPNTFSDSTVVDVSQGKKLLAFFSVQCPHCKQAAFKLSVMKRKNLELPVFVYFWGDSTKVQSFISSSNMDLPYVFYTGSEFMKIVGGSVPAIFLVDNGIIKERWDKLTLDAKRIEKEFPL